MHVIAYVFGLRCAPRCRCDLMLCASCMSWDQCSAICSYYLALPMSMVESSFFRSRPLTSGRKLDIRAFSTLTGLEWPAIVVSGLGTRHVSSQKTRRAACELNARHPHNNDGSDSSCSVLISDILPSAATTCRACFSITVCCVQGMMVFVVGNVLQVQTHYQLAQLHTKGAKHTRPHTSHSRPERPAETQSRPATAVRHRAVPTAEAGPQQRDNGQSPVNRADQDYVIPTGEDRQPWHG